MKKERDYSKEIAWFTAAINSQCEDIRQINERNLQQIGFNKLLKLCSLIKGLSPYLPARLDAMYFWRMVVHECNVPEDKNCKFTKEIYKMCQNVWRVSKVRQYGN